MTPMEEAKDAALRGMYGPGLLRKVKEHGGDRTLEACAEAAVLAYLQAVVKSEPDVEAVRQSICDSTNNWVDDRVARLVLQTLADRVKA